MMMCVWISHMTGINQMRGVGHITGINRMKYVLISHTTGIDKTGSVSHITGIDRMKCVSIGHTTGIDQMRSAGHMTGIGNGINLKGDDVHGVQSSGIDTNIGERLEIISLWQRAEVVYDMVTVIASRVDFGPVWKESDRIDQSMMGLVL